MGPSPAKPHGCGSLKRCVPTDNYHNPIHVNKAISTYTDDSTPCFPVKPEARRWRSNPMTEFQLSNSPNIFSNTPPATAWLRTASANNEQPGDTTNNSKSIFPPTPRNPNPIIPLSVAKNG